MADDGGARARMVAGESIFTAELGRVICRRVAAGESVMALCRDAEMPNRATVHKWARTDGAFRGALYEAMRVARFEKRRLDREVAAAKAARPKPVKGGSVSTYTAAVGEAICMRLANGESLVAIVRDPAMPCYGTVYGWLKRHPDFADLYVQARQIQADYLFDEAREVALAATPLTVWVGRLQFDVIRWQTARMAPKKYLERVVVAQELEAPEAGERRLQIDVVHFRKGPNGQVLVAPPRNDEEATAWVEAYGKPYDGPGFTGEARR